ncbi:nucleotidyltransferase domain-containing protein [Streptomyces sp. NBC_01017]|uniref:nucleotidyltransferase domain-containing protein n=1 Tax=Streptomyces sp. NBC_01017 TaxID=2903721 RepID=UPI00386D9336
MARGRVVPALRVAHQLCDRSERLRTARPGSSARDRARGARCVGLAEPAPNWSAARCLSEQVAERLAGVSAPWCIAAGWALDLFRGRQSRPHGDLEIAVPSAGFTEIRERFPEYAFDAVGSGRVWANADAEVLAATHRTWLRDPVSGQFLFDVFREPHDGGTWICRRDESLRLPYDAIVERTAEGIPYLVPELVLLFKAKAARPKDQADFDGALPQLSQATQALAWATYLPPSRT